MGVTVSGNEPSDGWVKLEKNQIVDYSLKFDEYVVDYDTNTKEITVTKNGEIEINPEEQAELDNVKAIAKTYIETALTNNSSLTSETVKDTTTLAITQENGPSNGWIHFDKTDDGVIIKDYSLQIGEYVVDYSSEASDNMSVTKNGIIRNIPLIIISVVDGVKYYDSTWINANPVYYDPTGVDTDCTVDDYNNNENKLGKTGCMKWYAYSENADGTVNMLLDHNTTPKIAWVTSEHYGTGISELATSLGITYPNGNITGVDDFGNAGNWNKGPITLLNQLKLDTDGWSDELIRSDSYTNRNFYNNNWTVIDRYTINYSGYKSRLITAQEIANITENSWNEVAGDYFKFSDLTYAWLVINTYARGDDSNYGYHTSSSNANEANNAWDVSCDGDVYDTPVYVNGAYGVRPVITLPKSVIEN